MANKTGEPIGGNIVSSSINSAKSLIGSPNIYAYNSSNSSAKYAIINNYDFSDLPSNTRITGYKVTVKCSQYDSTYKTKTKISYRLVTGISQGSGTYTSISPSEVTILSGAGSLSYRTSENTNESSTEVIWLNNNLSAVKDGTNFGVYIYGIYCAIYYVSLQLYYEDSSTVLYDTEFDYQKWKAKGITAGTGAISNITDTGFTMTANANDTYTGESHVFKLTEGQTYTIKYDTSGGASNECFVFYHSSETAGWNSFTNSTSKQFNFTVPSGYPYCTIRLDVNTSGETITFNNILIVKSSETWRFNTISAYTSRTNTDSWSMPTATREHYTFSGWKDANGTTYTASSTYPSTDTVLYSQWTVDRHTISTAASPSSSGSVSGAGQYDYGSSVTLAASPASGYAFVRWNDNSTANPRTVTVSENATYTAYFEMLSKIFVGNSRASAVHVGSTKAQAVYLGNTKIL